MYHILRFYLMEVSKSVSFYCLNSGSESDYPTVYCKRAEFDQCSYIKLVFKGSFIYN